MSRKVLIVDDAPVDRQQLQAIVAKAGFFEERGGFTQALEQWQVLRSIHWSQPGLDFEIERLMKRRDQQSCENTKARSIRMAGKIWNPTWPGADAGRESLRGNPTPRSDPEYPGLRAKPMESIAFNPANPAAPTRAGAALPMTPTQALLAGFEFDAAPGSSSSAVEAERSMPSARLEGMQFRQGFRIGSLNLMIRFEDGSELTELPDVYRLPNAPGWVRGMANLHGMLIPVFDLAGYLGLARDAQAKPMLLVLSHGADAAGVVIDGIAERLRWQAEDQIDSDSAPSRGAPWRTACLVGRKLWFDLDCMPLLAAPGAFDRCHAMNASCRRRSGSSIEAANGRP
jgi:chemotaxis signal transduction protein